MGWASETGKPCDSCGSRLLDGRKALAPLDYAADGLRRLTAELRGSGHLSVPFVNLTRAEQDRWRAAAGVVAGQLQQGGS